MKAGRELDALVAEKVMGIVPPDLSGFKERYRVTGVFQLADGSGKRVDCGTYEKPAEWTPPPYSTDIAAAWEVVEKLQERGHSFAMQSTSGTMPQMYAATFGLERPILPYVESAPLAICLAALKAVGAL